MGLKLFSEIDLVWMGDDGSSIIFNSLFCASLLYVHGDMMYLDMGKLVLDGKGYSG